MRWGHACGSSQTVQHYQQQPRQLLQVLLQQMSWRIVPWPGRQPRQQQQCHPPASPHENGVGHVLVKITSTPASLPTAMKRPSCFNSRWRLLLPSARHDSSPFLYLCFSLSLLLQALLLPYCLPASMLQPSHAYSSCTVRLPLVAPTRSPTVAAYRTRRFQAKARR